MFKNIAVAFEETPESRNALRAAFELARKLGAPLTSLTVVGPLPAYAAFAVAADTAAWETLEQDRSDYCEQLKLGIMAEGLARGVEVSVHILNGDRVQSIVEFVDKHHVDLLVVGLHRRSLPLTSLWSTVYSLAQSLSCSVLGVH